MATFQTKADLPQAAQAELARILAIASAQRTTVEANFLTARNDYVYNEKLLLDTAGEIVIARGVTLPTGLSGFAVGAFFTKVDAAAEDQGLYENVGTITSAVWRAVGGQVTAFTLSSAQILALHTTPISLVAAKGSGIVTIVDEIVAKQTFGTVAYTGSNALEFRYTNASGAKVSADLPATLINAASGVIYGSVKGVVTALVPVANAAITVSVPTADPAAGDGVITGFIRYHTVTL